MEAPPTNNHFHPPTPLSIITQYTLACYTTAAAMVSTAALLLGPLPGTAAAATVPLSIAR